jgi:formylglycine-generating enzyme required for sulfatase activity
MARLFISYSRSDRSKVHWLRDYATQIIIGLVVGVMVTYLIQANRFAPRRNDDSTLTPTTFATTPPAIAAQPDSPIATDDAIPLLNQTRTQAATATPSPDRAARQTQRMAAIPTLSPQQIALTPQASNASWRPHITARDFGGVTMVLVPAGQFLMGSSEAEIDAAFALCNATVGDDSCFPSWFESEAHNNSNLIRFATPFWIDQTEVTRAQYEACVDAGGCQPTPASDFSTQPQQPINHVMWEQANTYCEWRGARLPNEAEWEYAARGPDRLIYPWGNVFTGAEANHCDSNCAAAEWASRYRFTHPEHDDGHAITAPVGSYEAGISWVGAYDMGGNVWEWVTTIYDPEKFPYPYVTDDGREDMTSTGVPRVVRGGSFITALDAVRTAYRSGDGFVEEGVGFRCVVFE